MNGCITVAVAGFGLRAKDYTKYQIKFPGTMKVVAIAEPNEERRQYAKDIFHIKDENVFTTAEEMLQKKRLADVLFVTTQDRQHVEQAIMGLERGYDILIEKPISNSLEECIRLQKKATETGKSVTVCHVMRYTHFFQTIKKAIMSETIGDVISIQAIENVGYFHHAHSFVRGNWRRSDETSPMILAKCCHDMDLILWLMNKECTHVASYGNLNYFKEERAPEGAAKRCLDGCRAKENCPFDAEKIYVTDKVTGIKNGIWKWPCTAVVNNPTVDKIYKALDEGPYGRCVFYCDNDVVDHQVVIMNFEDGSTADFTMSAFTTSDGRQIKIMGTLGNIIADIDTNIIKIEPFGKDATIIDIGEMTGVVDGHAGGDEKIIEHLLQSLNIKYDKTEKDGNKEADTNISLTSIYQSVHSHVVALAAEESRLHQGKCIDLKTFIKGVE